MTSRTESFRVLKTGLAIENFGLDAFGFVGCHPLNEWRTIPELTSNAVVLLLTGAAFNTDNVWGCCFRANTFTVFSSDLIKS